MNRTQVEKRKTFWLNQKKKMLAKSDGKCSHCGRTIDLKSMTVEHVIPLSKGGTNDLSNTVALCSRCNKIKRNYVTEPQFFYHYLKDEYKVELEEAYNKFLNDFNWVSLKSYFKNDVFNSDVEGMLFVGDAKLSRADKRKMKLEIAKLQRLVVSLDTRDFDEVISFCEKYGNRVLGLKEIKVNKTKIYEYLRDYAIYGIKRGSEYSGLMFIKPDVYLYYKPSIVIEILPLYEDCAYYLSHLWTQLVSGFCKDYTVSVVIVTPKNSKVFDSVHGVLPDYQKHIRIVGGSRIFSADFGHGKDFCMESFGNVFINKLPKDYEKFNSLGIKGKKALWYKERIKRKLMQSNPITCKIIDNWSFTQCILQDEKKTEDAEMQQLYDSGGASTAFILLLAVLALIFFGYSNTWLYATISSFCCVLLITVFRVSKEEAEREKKGTKR